MQRLSVLLTHLSSGFRISVCGCSPLLIGKVLDKTNVGVTDPTQLNYTAPLVMLAGLGVIALIIGLTLKVVDKKRNLGLEEPNIKE